MRDTEWLIFALPPSEAAFHPAVGNERPELYLMCDDLAGTVEELKSRGAHCGTVREERWGQITTLTLQVAALWGYQPKHPRPSQDR